MSNNKVVVITGPTGVGKTTIAKYIAANWQATQVITHTTRAPRKNEVNGRDYYFENQQSFKQHQYIESVVYAGSHYGSSFEGLERAWRSTRLAVIVLDAAGAVTYAQELGDQAIIIYVVVSNPDVLLERLTQRGDHPTRLKVRIQSKEFQRDLVLPQTLIGKAIRLLNDDWATCRQKIDEIIQRL